MMSSADHLCKKRHTTEWLEYVSQFKSQDFSNETCNMFGKNRISESYQNQVLLRRFSWNILAMNKNAMKTALNQHMLDST